RSLLCEELSDLRPGGDDLAVEALQLSLLVVDVVRDGAEQHDGQHGHGQGRAESGQPHCLRNRLTPREPPTLPSNRPKTSIAGSTTRKYAGSKASGIKISTLCRLTTAGR